MQAWGLEWQKEKRGREAANPEWESALENGKRGWLRSVEEGWVGLLGWGGGRVAVLILGQVGSGGEGGWGRRWWGWRLVVGAKHIPARPELNAKHQPTNWRISSRIPPLCKFSFSKVFHFRLLPFATSFASRCANVRSLNDGVSMKHRRWWPV